MARATMSIEAAMDEERRDVLELLEGGHSNEQEKRGSASSAGSAVRSSSPFTIPIRSMLDITTELPKHASIAIANSNIPKSTTPAQSVRSMLDIGPRIPSPKTVQASPTKTTHKSRSMLDIGLDEISKTPSSRVTPLSPSEGIPRSRNTNGKIHPRSKSDAAVRQRPPAEFGSKRLSTVPPKAAAAPPKEDKTAGFQFSGYLSSNPGGPFVPKRNTLAGKKAEPPPTAMAGVVRGDLSGYSGPRDRGRHSTTGTTVGGSSKSKSPHNRLGVRSISPNISNTNAVSLSVPGKLALDNGTLVDKSNAYRKLSDANLAKAGGRLSILSNRNRRRTTSGSTPESSRLEKDYSYNAEDGAAVESSDEDGHTSDEERHRGREKAAKDQHPESKTLGMGRAKGPRTALSLMGAAEEERQMIADEEQRKASYHLDPAISVTGPGASSLKYSKPGIHPTNAFDLGGISGINTPHDSETEADITDIRRAQKLLLNYTKITSNIETSRCVRTIFRGDFEKMQKEAQDNQRRVRKYLVATDLSDEAAHALEWTIGTVLRDGDTLLAIYCVDEETGINPESTFDADSHIQAANIAATTNKPLPTNLPSVTNVAPTKFGGSRSATASPTGRDRNRAEQERYRAVEDITARVSKLLRKTRLQVRVVVEVIHCKSPKHLITEVIDFINPTLVILGSRGRSALKGVILGSFSNYLVTKSSVPVMVARKRLRKHSKYKRPSVRLANNLTSVSGNSLASAKID